MRLLHRQVGGSLKFMWVRRSQGFDTQEPLALVEPQEPIALHAVKPGRLFRLGRRSSRLSPTAEHIKRELCRQHGVLKARRQSIFSHSYRLRRRKHVRLPRSPDEVREPPVHEPV